MQSIVEDFRKGKIEIKHLGLFEMWNVEEQSKFIERVLLKLHTPSITLVELNSEEGQYENIPKEIISGAEYVIAAMNFLDDKLTLKGLKYLTKLNGCQLSDLSQEVKQKIAESGFFLNIYNNEAAKKYDSYQLKRWSI